MAEAPAQFRRARLIELRITYDLAFDRIVYKSYTIHIEGNESMRKRMGGLG